MTPASMMTLAQQSSGNYVRVTEHLNASGSQTRSTTTYYNGMGWPVETVQSGYNPQDTDIATLTEYDGNGRAVRQWERTAVSGYSNGESFTYDMMGNVTQIERRGMQDDDTYSPIDDLILTYDGNQLTHVEEYAEEEPATKGSMHFSQAAGSSAQYAWDANGNMTRDRNRGIDDITYDARSCSGSGAWMPTDNHFTLHSLKILHISDFSLNFAPTKQKQEKWHLNAV